MQVDAVYKSATVLEPGGTRKVCGRKTHDEEQSDDLKLCSSTTFAAVAF